ncbi:MAG: hypothetical protein IJP62_03170 [Treponema sp.]|nr:hypothetical protein [Treponema sp.]
MNCKCITFLKQMLLVSAVSLCFPLAQSCSTLENVGCPYIIDNPHVEIGENHNYHNYAGAYLTVYNDSEKTIQNYTVSFMLYDSDGEIPFTGTNCVVAECQKEIAPRTEEEFVVSLDSFISVVPDEPYVIDYLYLREIEYTDGSNWKDPFGMYAQREVNE